MVHKLKTIRGDMLVLQCQLERELIRYVRRYLCQPQVTIITNDNDSTIYAERNDLWRTNTVIGGDKDFQQIRA